MSLENSSLDVAHNLKVVCLLRNLPKCIFYLLLLLVTVFAARTQVSEEGKVVQLGPCTCQIGDKVVDLTPIAFQNDTPRFKDVASNYPFKFSWNPCYDFHEGKCRGVAGCQQIAFPRQHYSLGPQKSARCIVSDDQVLQLYYQAKPSKGFQRKLYVTLKCTDEGEKEKLVANGERRSQRGVYDLTLYSRHACPRAQYGDSGMGLSVGSIMCITFGLLVFVYLVTGVLVQIFVRKASGLQIIPHVSWWSRLPGLVKDGFVFTKYKGKVGLVYQEVS